MKLIKKRFVVLALLCLALFIFYRQNYEVPILMYHHVGDEQESGGNNVSTEAFTRQMEFLKVHRYRVISLEELLETIKAGKPIPWKTVVITFDDGYLDNIKNALPVLKKMHFRATIFMITSTIDKNDWLSQEDLKVLDGSGIAIGSHTVNHAYLPAMSKESVLFELRESRNRLEKILGHPVFLFSYPSGGFTPEIRDWVAEQGYKGAVTTNRGKAPLDPYALHRIKVTEARKSLFNFWLKVSGLYQWGKTRR